jgi:hypothetical protein
MKRMKARSQTGLDPSFLRRVSLNPARPNSPRRSCVGQLDGPGVIAAKPASVARVQGEAHSLDRAAP